MPTSLTFKDLLYDIDDDINDVRVQRGADALDYTVTIDGRQTSVVARSTFTRQNVISFLLNTELESGYVMVYLSDTDIAQIMSRLNGVLYTNIRSYFQAIYDTSEHRRDHDIVIQREGLQPGIPATLLSSSQGFFAIPSLRRDDLIATHLGFSISYGDFCDILSLIVSKEGDADVGRLVGKFSILSNQLRVGSYKVALGRGYVARFRTIGDIEDAYADAVTHKRSKKRDEELFSSRLLDSYFHSF